MPWSPTTKEIEELLIADSQARYKYFLNHVCDSQKIWSLYDDGWATLGDDSGNEMIPFWPHALYAEKFKENSWANYKPKEIDVEEFVESWLPNMKRENVLAAIFPTPSGNSVIVSLEDLEANIRYELGKY